MKKRLFPIMILCFLTLLSCGKTQESHTVSGFYFDTYVNITLYEKNDELDAKLKELLDRDELIYSATDPEGEVYKLNHEASDFPLSNELTDTLKAAAYYESLSDGAVNATIGSVSGLWDFHAEEPMPPADEDIAAALTEIRREADLFNDRDISIDLGFIAKGAISEHIRDLLLEYDADSAIIDLGGNIVVLGSKPDGSAYTVGIEKPFAGGELLKTLEVRDTCVVTSGIYERCFTYEGSFYHHILDPATGYPVENNLYSATVICRDPVRADALSTACMVLGKEKALELAESLDDCELILCDKDYNIISTQ